MEFFLSILKQINYFAPQLRLAMGKMDKNKDGKISKNEYLELKAKNSHNDWNKLSNHIG